MTTANANIHTVEQSSLSADEKQIAIALLKEQKNLIAKRVAIEMSGKTQFQKNQEFNKINKLGEDLSKKMQRVKFK